jgi:hypothetical protein
LYLPRVFVRIEKSMEWMVLAVETEVRGENLPRRHFVHHRSHLPDGGANPDRRVGKSATNRFSYGAAIQSLYRQSLCTSGRCYLCTQLIVWMRCSTFGRLSTGRWTPNPLFRGLLDERDPHATPRRWAPCSQEPATGSYPKQVQSTLHHMFFIRCVLILSSNMRLESRWGLSQGGSYSEVYTPLACP